MWQTWNQSSSLNRRVIDRWWRQGGWPEEAECSSPGDGENTSFHSPFLLSLPIFLIYTYVPFSTPSNPGAAVRTEPAYSLYSTDSEDQVRRVAWWVLHTWEDTLEDVLMEAFIRGVIHIQCISFSRWWSACSKLARQSQIQLWQTFERKAHQRM